MSREWVVVYLEEEQKSDSCEGCSFNVDSQACYSPMKHDCTCKIYKQKSIKEVK
jgi:hypothetical protein